MCTKLVKELEAKRGYVEVNYLLRASNVDNSKIGHELLKIAIMTYLHNPSAELEELIAVAKENSPMPIDDDKTCFNEMKEALQTVYSKHSEKVEDDNVVFKFINNIASEIRMNELMRIRILKKGLEVSQDIIELFIKVSIRKIMKPQDTFKEVLNHVAGRHDYYDVEVFVKELYKLISNDEAENIESAISEIEIMVSDVIKNRNEIIF